MLKMVANEFFEIVFYHLFSKKRCKLWVQLIFYAYFCHEYSDSSRTELQVERKTCLPASEKVCNQ
jgi:hypothetical protein